jgi:hypothetical protein
MALIGGSNELDATKMDMIANVVQKEIAFRAKLAPFFMDLSQFAVKGNTTVSFPRIGSFTAEARAAGAAFTEQTVASAVDQMALDRRIGVHYVIDPDEEIESVLNFELSAAQRAASANARLFDTDLIAELETVGVAVTPTGDITRDIILEMREGLLSREADLDSEGVILVGVDQETALLKISEFSNQDIYGPNGAVRSGQIGTLYGMPVVRHSGLAASTYYMGTKSALGYAFQKRPRIGQQKAVEYGADAIKTTVNQKYGVKAMQINEGGVGAAESAWVMKDNNV